MLFRLRTILAAVTMAVLGSAAMAAGQHGEYFPNPVLQDENGKPQRFYDDVIKGKVVALNFIFTKCTDVCPTDTAQMLQVRELLGDRVGKDIFFYSISIDPDNDTPEALRKYKTMFGIGPEWKFLTGNIDDITLIQKKLGLIGEVVPALKDHNITLIVGNEVTSHWIKRTPFDHPKVLANLLGDELSNNSGASGRGLKPFSTAQERESPSSGALLFRSRCMACHTIGKGDKLGPDLAGVVTARPRDWLKRWIKEPNKMLEEGDPVATAMQARYRGLPMPNLGLTDQEVEDLIQHLADPDGVASKPAMH